jgi:hypothetical protein
VAVIPGGIGLRWCSAWSALEIGEGRMSGFPAVVVYLAVVAVLLAAYKIVKSRLDSRKP